MPSSLSLSPFGIIVAAVAAVPTPVIIVTVILVAPATVALSAFVIALAVVTATFLIPRRLVTADGHFHGGRLPLHGLIPYYLLVFPPHIERNLIHKLRV